LNDYYTVTRDLGSGGFSTVRLGTNKSTGAEVAVKTIQKARGSDNALIRNEITMMTYMIQHKAVMKTNHVINMVDVFDEPRAVHVVLEMCEGGELFDRIIAKGQYSEQCAATAIQQICCGLRGLHTVKILHRDMKPENLLYKTKEEDSPLLIVDFGLSTIQGTPDAMDGLFGSLDYIAPEALTRKAHCEATDMWAVGVIMYILLSGYPPFWADTTREKQLAIIHGKYEFDDPLWRIISNDAKSLIQGLLHVDPTKRLTAEQVLQHPWVRNLDRTDSTPLPREVSDRIVLFNAKRKFRAAAYAAVCMARSLKTLHSNLKQLCGPRTLSDSELNHIRTAFNEIADGARGVTYPLFQQVMASLNIHFPNEERIFQLFDVNSDNYVDYRELVMGLALLRESAPADGTYFHDDRTLRFCFDVYDTDANGWLSKDEMQAMVSMLATEADKGVVQADTIAELFESMDTNHDGQVSFEEFKEAIKMNQANHFLVDGILSPAKMDLS